MAPFMLLHRVIRIALQRSWKCDLRSMLVGRDVLSTLALVFFAYLALSGSVRSEKSAQEISDLFYIVRTLMPYGKPATLSKQEYIDMIAYLLMMNGHPAGAQALPLDPSMLGHNNKA